MWRLGNNGQPPQLRGLPFRSGVAFNEAPLCGCATAISATGTRRRRRAPTYISMAMCRHAAPHSRHVAAHRVSTASFLKASQA